MHKNIVKVLNKSRVDFRIHANLYKTILFCPGITSVRTSKPTRITISTFTSVSLQVFYGKIMRLLKNVLLICLDKCIFQCKYAVDLYFLWLFLFFHFPLDNCALVAMYAMVAAVWQKQKIARNISQQHTHGEKCIRRGKLNAHFL